MIIRRLCHDFRKLIYLSHLLLRLMINGLNVTSIISKKERKSGYD